MDINREEKSVILLVWNRKDNKLYMLFDDNTWISRSAEPDDITKRIKNGDTVIETY